MATNQAISPELRLALTAPEGALDTEDYYHSPVWAPGARLMARLPFAAKAMVICLMFLVPLAWVSWAYYTTQSEAIAFSDKELLGVQYTREVFPVLNLAQQLRRDATAAAVSGAPPASMADVRSRLETAQAKLAEVHHRLGSELDATKAYATVQAALREADKASGMDAVFKANTAHVESLIALLQTVTDNSNLTLDPDIDSYYLMDASLFRIPDIVESTGKLRGLGLAVMKSGSATELQQRVLNDTIPIAEFQLHNMTDGVAKAFAYNATLKAKIDAKPTLEATAAFFALARTAVVNGKDYTPESQAK
jgi:hypothetical protein